MIEEQLAKLTDAIIKLTEVVNNKTTIIEPSIPTKKASEEVVTPSVKASESTSTAPLEEKATVSTVQSYCLSKVRDNALNRDVIKKTLADYDAKTIHDLKDKLEEFYTKIQSLVV